MFISFVFFLLFPHSPRAAESIHPFIRPDNHHTAIAHVIW